MNTSSLTTFGGDIVVQGTGNSTFAGDITVSGNQFFNGEFIEGDGKEMFRYSDGWLRINEDNDFGSGIYCGTGLLRTDGEFQIGGSGQYAKITSTGNATFAGTVSGTTATFTTFFGDLSGTINTITTAVTKPNATDDDTVATTAFVVNKIAELPAGLIFLGTWNAATNTPTLASGGGERSEGTTTTLTANKLIDSAATFTTAPAVVAGDRVRVVTPAGPEFALVTSVDSATQLTLAADIVTATGEAYILEVSPFIPEGNYYIVSDNGTTDLNGIDVWSTGDWVVASSTNVWQKIINSSVLDGTGTGQTLPLWSGSGTSNTLTDSNITQDANLITRFGKTATTATAVASINHASNDFLYINGGTAGAAIGDDNQSTRIVFYNNDYIRFDTAGSEKMRIENNGNVGIGEGTTNPAARLEVSTEVANGGGQLIIANRSTDAATTPTKRSEIIYKVTDTVGTVKDAAYVRVTPANQNNTTGSSYAIWTSKGSSSPTESMRIDSSGNVGIGTDNPSNQLHVHTDTDDSYGIRIEGSTNNAAGVWTGLGIGGESTNTKSAVLFEDVGLSYARGKLHLCVNNAQDQTSATPADAKLTVNNDGNVGIGTTSPDGKLDVAQNMTAGTTTAFTSPHLSLTALNATDNTGFVGMTFATSDSVNYGWSWGALRTNGGLGDMVLRNHYNSAQGTEKMRILANGNVGIGVDDPDAKLEIKGTGTAYGLTFKTTDSVGNENFFIQDGGRTGVRYYPLTIGLDSGTSPATGARFQVSTTANDFVVLNDSSTGIGTITPQSKLQVAGGIQMADDDVDAVAAKAGTMRYRTATDEPVPITGTDLVTNGDLASSTGWNLQNSASINNTTGVATVPGGPTYNGSIASTGGNWSLYQSNVMAPSKTYMLRFQARRSNGPDANMYAGFAYQAAFSQTVTADFVQYQVVFTTLSNAWNELTFGGVTGTTFEVKDISVVEVTEENASYADMCMQTGASTYEWVNIVRNTY